MKECGECRSMFNFSMEKCSNECCENYIIRHTYTADIASVKIPEIKEKVKKKRTCLYIYDMENEENFEVEDLGDGLFRKVED